MDCHQSAIESICGTLYCRSVFFDFRRPVIAMYPDIAQAYCSAIQTPVDLGSLLVAALKKNLTADSFRRKLHLLKQNAMKFNEEASVMYSIAIHLDMFAEGLYEEILNLPYRGSGERFQQNKQRKRQLRFDFVCNEDLNTSEVAIFERILRDTADEVPPSLAESLEDILACVVGYVINGSTTEYLNLTKLLSPLVELAEEDSRCNGGSCAAHRFSFCTSKVALKSEYEAYFTALDNALGFLLVLLEERKFRGTTCSHKWLKPHPAVIWAQPPKDSKNRSPWWPALVTCSQSPLYELSSDVMSMNLSRLPTDLKKQLNKLKPRIPSKPSHALSGNGSASNDDGMLMDSALTSPAAASSVNEVEVLAHLVPPATDLECPDGYLLLEFLGSHDYGWARGDAVLPYTDDGADGLKDLLQGHPTIKANLSNLSICQADILVEAQDVFQYLSLQHHYCGETNPTEKDIPLPSLEALEESVQIPEEILQYALHGGAEGTTPAASALKRKLPDIMDDDSDDNAAKRRSAAGGLDTLEYEVNGVLAVSKCPVAVALRFPEYSSQEEYAKHEVFHCTLREPDCPLRQSANRPHFRANALSRVRYFASWAEKLKPYSLSRFSATKNNKVTLAAMSEGNRVLLERLHRQKGGHVAAAAADVRKPANIGRASSTGSTPDGCVAVKGEKRKYVFKNRVTSSSVMNALLESRGEDHEEDEHRNRAAASTEPCHAGKKGTHPPGNPLDAGGTKYLLGEGPVYSRCLHDDADVSALEHSSRAVRKAILRDELANIQEELNKLVKIAADRSNKAASRQGASNGDSLMKIASGKKLAPAVLGEELTSMTAKLKNNLEQLNSKEFARPANVNGSTPSRLPSNPLVSPLKIPMSVTDMMPLL